MKIREMETFEDLKKVLSEIIEEWDLLKKSDKFKFTEYTDEKIKILTDLIFSKAKNDTDYLTKFPKAFNLICEIENLHFKGAVDISLIFMDSNVDLRIKYFLKYNSFLTDEEYWEYLSKVYQSQDYNPIPLEILSALFNSTRKGKYKLMNENELKFYNNLPDEIEIYRAMSKKEFESKNYRFSWTLSENIANFFLDRNKLIYGDDMVVHKLVVNKINILAYLNDRKEEEIIYIQ